jgi:hypothetical protein
MRLALLPEICYNEGNHMERSGLCCTKSRESTGLF